MPRTVLVALLAVLLSGALPAAAVAQAPPPGTPLFACIRFGPDGATGQLTRILTTDEECRRGELRVAWASGPQGIPGPAGSTGPTGPQGTAGSPGPTGSQGIPGSQGVPGTPGATGTAGPTGVQGPAGVSGPTGPSGAAGATGVAGPTGSQGPTGVAGPTGVQGPIGPTGPSGPEIFGVDVVHGLVSRGRECTLGEVILSAGVRPVGLPADGRLLSIAQFSPLFSLMGTMYGGNGTTNFALPDLRPTTPNGLTYTICDEGIFPVAD